MTAPTTTAVCHCGADLIEQEDAHCKFAYDGEHALCHWTRAQHATFGPASHEWQGETACLNGHVAR